MHADLHTAGGVGRKDRGRQMRARALDEGWSTHDKDGAHVTTQMMMMMMIGERIHDNMMVMN